MCKSKKNRQKRKQNPSGRKLNSGGSCPKSTGKLIVVVRRADNKTDLPLMKVSLNPAIAGNNSTDSGGYWFSPELPCSACGVTISFTGPSEFAIVGGNTQTATPDPQSEIVLFTLAPKPKLKVKFVWKPNPTKIEPVKIFDELPIQVTSSLGPSMNSVNGVADFGATIRGKHTLTITFRDPTENKFDFTGATEQNPTQTQKEVELEAGDDKTVVVEVEPLYTKVVFIGHCLLTIPKQIFRGNRWRSEYTGLAPEADDIEARVELLSDLIEQAYGVVGDKEYELKVFMIPECFFLGRNGAYLVSGVSTLIAKLQNVVMSLKWRHWVFAFGTVNGVSEIAGTSGDELRKELFNFAPVIRGGFQSVGNASAYTKLIQKTFYCAEMASQDELIVPVDEQPFYGEMFNMKFGATQNEATYSRLVRELLSITWDNDTEEWIPNAEETLIGTKTINVFCCEKGWKTGDWFGLSRQVLNQVTDRGMIAVVREMREGRGAQWGGDRFKKVVEWYAESKNTEAENPNSKKKDKISPDVLKADERFAFYPQDFIFRCGRKPGPWLEADNLPQNRKITFGLEICADHTRSRVKNARSDTDREIESRFLVAEKKVQLLKTEKQKLAQNERKFAPETQALEEIVRLLQGGEEGQAKQKIKDLYSEALDPNTMEGMLNDRTVALNQILDRKPKLEDELRIATEEQNNVTLEKTASAKQKELDIHLVPSAGMILLPLNVAMRPGGFAFNCDGWNASSAQLPKITDRGAAIVTVHNVNWPTDGGHNPLHPHSEVVKSGMEPVATSSVIDLAEDVTTIFAEGPGQLHIYPPQDLPN